MLVSENAGPVSLNGKTALSRPGMANDTLAQAQEVLEAAQSRPEPQPGLWVPWEWLASIVASLALLKAVREAWRG